MESAGRAPFARERHVRVIRSVQMQIARHCGDFGVAEFVQDAKDIAIDRLLPDILFLAVVADDGRLFDARIDRRCR